MTQHHFHLQANWPGGRNSSGYIDAGELKTKISIPPGMDGPGIGTSPDEMLLGAAATCYLITLAAMIERASLPLKEINLASEGIVEFKHGVNTYQKIIHQPYISLDDTAIDANYKKVSELVKKADESCMISRTLKRNVTVELQSLITYE